MGNSTSGYFNFQFYKSAVEGPEFDYNPSYNQSRLYSDYTGFYVGIFFCTFIALVVFLVNLYFCQCSPWSKYWKNRHTGNRMTLPLFTSPPKDQTPILI